MHAIYQQSNFQLWSAKKYAKDICDRDNIRNQWVMESGKSSSRALRHLKVKLQATESVGLSPGGYSYFSLNEYFFELITGSFKLVTESVGLTAQVWA